MPDVPPCTRCPTCKFISRHERCDHCGQEVTYAGEESRVERLTKYWLYHHRCSRNISEFYGAHLGKPCGVCATPLMAREDIKVKRRTPMHRVCFTCQICGDGIAEPQTLRWGDEYRLPEEASVGLYHERCILRTYGSEAIKVNPEAPLTPRERKRREKARSIRRKENGQFAEITVPRRLLRGRGEN